MNTPIRPHFSALACFLLPLLAVSCFGAPVQEEAPEVELPPYIAADFITPDQDVVLVESDAPVELSVETLLDPNPGHDLHFVFIGERSGVIEQATASRKPTSDLYRDLFYQFDRAEITVDPCSERLRDHDDELIRLYVTDRPFERLSDGGVDVSDDAFLVSHRWLLRFREQLCA